MASSWSQSDNNNNKFRCSVDGQWLLPSAFPTQQLAKWESERRKPGVNRANIGLVCTNHSAAPAERKCHLCRRRKAVAAFSKRQRNEPEPICIPCMAHKDSETAEDPRSAARASLAPSAPVYGGYDSGSDGGLSDDDLGSLGTASRTGAGPRQTYTAWDPSGRPQKREVGGQQAATNSGSVDRPVTVGRSGWAKGDSRKRFEVAPAFENHAADDEEDDGYSSGSPDEM